MKKLNCYQCGYSWKPQVKNPIQCPCCKSRQWNNNGPLKIQYQKKKIRTRVCPQCKEYHQTGAKSNEAKCEECKQENREARWPKKKT